MPELSDQQRRKAMELEPRFAAARLVDLLERKCDLVFRCLACGTSKTWRRDTMLGRAKPFLDVTMKDLQRRAPCPRCDSRMVQLSMSGGVWDPLDLAEQFKWEVMEALREAGVDPNALGYGWRPPAARP